MHDLSTYIELIRSGEVVAFPTETVYGLGADAWNPSAIKKVFTTKGRPSDNPLIVHIAERDQVNDFADEISPIALKLMDAFWPGPVTIILQKKSKVLDLITAGLDTVAIRMPDHPIASEFISQAGPLVAPSANRSGKPSPTKAEHVKNDFGDDFPVIDGGATEVGLESTVVDFTTEIPSILRPGKIGSNELENILKIEVEVSNPGNAPSLPKSPGQKYSHYKPEAQVVYKEVSTFNNHTLYLMQTAAEIQQENVICYHGDLKQLSRELYDRFRQADHMEYSRIHIEPLELHRSEFPAYYDALINRIRKTLE